MKANRAKRREPISIAIKEHIRSYHRDNGKPSLKNMVAWAEEKYGTPFLPSTMGTILTPKPTKSGSVNALPAPCVERQRERSGNWPELEVKLASWYRSLSVSLKGGELKAKAEELWKSLSTEHYQGQKLPTFSNNWLDKFKERHGFKLKTKTETSASKNEHHSRFSVPNHTLLHGGGGAANAIITTEIDDVVFSTPVLPPHYNICTKLHSHNIGFAPILLKESNVNLRAGLQRKAAAQNYLMSPQAANMHPTKSRSSDMWECAMGMNHPISHEISSLPFELVSSYIQHEKLREGPNFSDVTPGTSYSEVSCKTQCKCRCGTKTHNIEAMGRDLTFRKRSKAHYMHPNTNTSFHHSHCDEIVRKSVASLLRMSSKDKQRSSTRPVEPIIKALASDIEAAEYHNLRLVQQRTLCSYHQSMHNRIDEGISLSKKVLKVLQLAKDIEVIIPTQKEWSEWQTQLDNTFISSSPIIPPDDDLEECDKMLGMQLSHDRMNVLQQKGKHAKSSYRTRRKFSSFTMKSSLWRIDMRTLALSGLNASGDSGLTAEVILTLHNSAQVRFNIPPTVVFGDKFSVVPTISIRKTIPRESEIFDMAENGTVGELIEMFSKGKASPEDCDPDGRSLMNYALSGLNMETSGYLLDFVTEIDAYEIDGYGFFGPLIINTWTLASESSEQTRERALWCFIKMIDNGADPSCEFDEGGSHNINTFHDRLLAGSKEAIEAILNLGDPLINANSFGDDDSFQLPPIIYLADCIRSYGSEKFDMINKLETLIKRGADIKSHDNYGNTCLHLILSIESASAYSTSQTNAHNYLEFKYILMAIITAGGDLRALNDDGNSPSEVACLYRNEEIWAESLAACGYNPWEFICLGSSALRLRPGESIFLAAESKIRSAKLSFQEYLGAKESSKVGQNSYFGRTWEGTSYRHRVALAGQVGIDAEDEYWSGDPCICDHCLHSYENIGGGAINSPTDHYIPINGDHSWLAYVYRPRYIFFPAHIDLYEFSDVKSLFNREDSHYENDEFEWETDSESNSENEDGDYYETDDDNIEGDCQKEDSDRDPDYLSEDNGEEEEENNNYLRHKKRRLDY